MGVRVKQVLVSLGLLSCLCFAVAPAGAASSDAQSKVIVVQPTDSVAFRASWSGAFSTRATTHKARASVVVRTSDANILTVAGFYSDGTQLPNLSHEAQPSTGAVTSLNISFDTHDGLRTDGWLVFQVSGGEPQGLPFTITRVVDASVIAKPIIGAFIIPLFFLLVRHRELQKRYVKNKHRLKWTQALKAGGKWTFSESFASNLTALGAILGTVLASKDTVTASLSNLSVGAFLGLSFGFAVIALLAPPTFSAFSKPSGGTYEGLMLAAFLTTAAVIGELSTLAIMLHRGGLPQVWGSLAMSVSLVVIGGYVWHAIGALVPVPEEGTEHVATTPLESRRASAIL